MTNEQEAHLLKIKQSFDILVDSKYRTGQREHGGNLWDKKINTLIADVLFEAIDLFVYVLTLRDSISHLHNELEIAAQKASGSSFMDE